MLEAAKDRLGRSDFGGVADAIKLASPLATDDARKKALEDVKSQVKAAAEKALANADAACKDKKYLPAVKTYLSLSGAFPTEEFGKTAKTKLAAAETDKDAAAVIPEAKASLLMDKVTTLIEQCRKAGKTGDDAEVVGKMPADDKAKTLQLLNDIVKTYAQTETGQKAKALLDKVQGGDKAEAGGKAKT